MKKSNTQKPTLFIIDDSEMITSTLEHIFSKSGNFEVLKFSTAEEALIAFKLVKPEIILLDFYLDSENPYNMNGHHAYKIIKEENPETHVLFMTSGNNLDLMETYNKFLSIDYMLKERFTPDYLLNKVELKLAV